MNEITRIHIAKTPYDIEVAAKKKLEKYIKSLEVYAQDADVIADIEIRITELLAERGVTAGGIIAVDDVAAVRKQLGEPYEFSGEGGDIAVGITDDDETRQTGSRRFFRSTDNALLGGVLSGVAAYFNVNPLWTRLVFVLLLFISFGFASLVYILFWILTPAARTATEKLQLAGKDVTVASIQALNAEEERSPRSRFAPVLQQVLSIGLGAINALAAVTVLISTVWLSIAALTFEGEFVKATNGFAGLGEGSIWLVWLLFWIVIFGLTLLAALFGLIAYSFFTKKLTKKVLISGIVIIVLGIASVATVVGVSATQSMRVANETRSMIRETKVTLPKEFAAVTSATFEMRKQKVDTGGEWQYGPSYPVVRYVVDDGPARYELTSLPTTSLVIKTEGTRAIISFDVKQNFRNSFAQPTLTIYGPALADMTSDSVDFTYEGQKQDTVSITASKHVNIGATGTFGKVEVNGSGSIDLASATVLSLSVRAEQNLSVTAGTVRDLTVVQPDVCPSGTFDNSTSVEVAAVTSGKINYNGADIPATTHNTSCAIVAVGESINDYEY